MTGHTLQYYSVCIVYSSLCTLFPEECGSCICSVMNIYIKYVCECVCVCFLMDHFACLRTTAPSRVSVGASSTTNTKPVWRVVVDDSLCVLGIYFRLHMHTQTQQTWERDQTHTHTAEPEPRRRGSSASVFFSFCKPNQATKCENWNDLTRAAASIAFMATRQFVEICKRRWMSSWRVWRVVVWGLCANVQTKPKMHHLYDTRMYEHTQMS